MLSLMLLSSDIKERNRLTWCATTSNVASLKMYLTRPQWHHQRDSPPKARRSSVVPAPEMKTICGSVVLKTLRPIAALNLLSSHVQVCLFTSLWFPSALSSPTAASCKPQIQTWHACIYGEKRHSVCKTELFFFILMCIGHVALLLMPHAPNFPICFGI